jgi:hypothetical protein
MGMKKVYKCDVCRDEMPPLELYGIHFTNMKDFDIGHAASTDGVHICERCMGQLRTKPLPQAGSSFTRTYKAVTSE